MTLGPAPSSNLEERLDAMGRAMETEAAGAPPPGFVSAIRSRRRVVLFTRVGTATAVLGALVIAAVLAQRALPTNRNVFVENPAPAPVGASPTLATTTPTIGDTRRFLNAPSGLDLLPAAKRSAAGGAPIRIGDRAESETVRALLRND